MLTRSLLKVSTVAFSQLPLASSSVLSCSGSIPSSTTSTCAIQAGPTHRSQYSIIRSMSTTSKHTSITHECLSDLYTYWFGHIKAGNDSSSSNTNNDDASLDLPKEALKIWFQGGEEVDNYCKSHFKGAVEQAIQTPTSDLIALGAKDETGKDALALILLLDQMPRNIYRGKEAKIAYQQCDPKAQQLAKTFTSDPYNYDSKKTCPTWWHQNFMYLPFMHSESLEMHDLILQKLDAAIQASDSEAEKKAITSTKAFEQKHYDVLKKYGRYPSRNEALDRKSTPEEEEMLKNGPGW